ncbi:hypothetical protein BS47DRAFT_1359874 [Hydnum rufescens UP504]|uniref:Uncharacterized protein n=1 Tax=Hydnum rufescens UP504 TaxID=1448309 RepID=A0A9P6DZV0_9AGAM|nr:hypothetical protein BS47DRAFT_1359874 [Hydnum rufescens UP504]
MEGSSCGTLFGVAAPGRNETSRLMRTMVIARFAQTGAKKPSEAKHDHGEGYYSEAHSNARNEAQSNRSTALEGEVKDRIIACGQFWNLVRSSLWGTEGRWQDTKQMARIWHLVMAEVFGIGPAQKAKNERLATLAEKYLMMLANNGNLIEFIVEEDVPMAFSRMMEGSVPVDTNALAPARVNPKPKEAVANRGRAPRRSADLAGARASGTGQQIVKDLAVCLTFEANLCLLDRIECSACCAKRIFRLKIRDLCKVLPSLLSERISSVLGVRLDAQLLENLCQQISWHHRLIRGSHWPERWEHLKPNGRSSQFQEIHMAKGLQMVVGWNEWHRWMEKGARLARTRFPAESV